MDKDAFLSMLQEAFQRSEPLSMDLPMADIPEWDSLTAMVALEIARRQFGKSLKLSDFKALGNVGDLYALLTRP